MLPGEVVGIDVNSTAFERARSHVAACGITNVRFVVADVHSLPFPRESFDAVWAHAVFEYLTP